MANVGALPDVLRKLGQVKAKQLHCCVHTTMKNNVLILVTLNKAYNNMNYYPYPFHEVRLYHYVQIGTDPTL